MKTWFEAASTPTVFVFNFGNFAGKVGNTDFCWFLEHETDVKRIGSWYTFK